MIQERINGIRQEEIKKQERLMATEKRICGVGPTWAEVGVTCKGRDIWSLTQQDKIRCGSEAESDHLALFCCSVQGVPAFDATKGFICDSAVQLAATVFD